MGPLRSLLAIAMGFAVVTATAAVLQGGEKQTFQYEHGDIKLPAAEADEPVRAEVSLEKAAESIENGALAWSRARNCIACHTNGSYLLMRPGLTSLLGRPSDELRSFAVEQLRELKNMPREEVLAGVRPAQVAWIAAGLSEWDVHLRGELSPETDEALRFLFDLQLESGTWGSLDCWPPFESSAYQLATVAAMASATAPGWLASLNDDPLKERVERLEWYLRTTSAPHDYGRLLLLWTSTRLPGLLDEEQRNELLAMVWRHQQEDGGWSIRTFAAPEEWGRGNRAQKLRAEPEFQQPPSDGHQTALCAIVLSDAGIPADDPRLARAVQWLLANQRESGRWWTRSLNTDGYHFITYSATCYALTALAKCNALTPADAAQRSD